ncbi:DUF4176 domain-containing protein [Candidatus Enterococcus mangumiae]|uniref:Beta-carotene 15,15'-monooxygenase n=1 Tax=Candidatus Enterococcus mangumiae TaxID=2230878 RepID=A0ABZ2SUS6_9ENTE|nr:DUF4176 domain-containing protein [Enterococcus sp. DIV1094]MBO0488592.1 DUF4176 domain-containing protein [Enterococcus sp. DIV1094]
MKKLFNATFEQSLKLLDDPLVDYMIRDTSKRSLYNGERKVLPVILFLMLVLFSYGIAILSRDSILQHNPASFLPIPSINFLPINLFWILNIIYLCSFIFFQTKSRFSNKLFIKLNNLNNYIILLVILMNLYFLTIFFKPLTLFGTLFLYLCVILVGYVLVISKFNALERLLFNSTSKLNKVDKKIEKLMDFILKCGGILIVIVGIWKFVFPDTGEVRNDIFGFIGIVFMWQLMNIGTIVAELYMFLPYLLHGYYKNKFPEEYRHLEGKTQLEWYGERYFNKHIKGTDREEK